MRKQQLNGETDYAFMKQKICEEAELVHLDEEDLKILWSGEAAFIWKSPHAASPEEAVRMARQAALEMTPAPGRVILAMIAQITMDMEWGLEQAEEILNLLQQILDKDAYCYFSTEFCSEGAHFVLATAEGLRKAVCKPKPISSEEE